MRILPVNNFLSNQNFKGKYEYYYGSYTIKDHADWHPASTMEKTLDAYHRNPTNKVYFASPMEPISDNIKEAADYIVYDNEPKYPDIDEVGLNYFNKLRVDFKKDFEERKHYFERRKFAGFASPEEAQQEINKADECIRMYNNGGHLRYVKEQAEDRIDFLEKDNALINRGMKAAEEELRTQQDIKVNIEKHISDLEKMKKPYNDVLNTAADGSINERAMYGAAKAKLAGVTDKKPENPYEKYGKNTTAATYEEIAKSESGNYRMTTAKEEAKKEYKRLEETTLKFESIKAGCLKTIKDIQANIETLKLMFATNKKEIAEKTSLIEDCKAKLIPIFDELKYFYANNGIKGLKKLK